MYSIGAILYLLISKGEIDCSPASTSPDKHSKKTQDFQFKEAEWLNTSDYTKDFIRACLHRKVQDRASIQQLMHTKFMKLHETDQLD